MICGSAPPIQCGVGEYTAQLARHLHAAGVQVTLITGVLEGRRAHLEGDPGFRHCEAVCNWHAASFQRLQRAIKEIDPDIVHVQYPSLGYDGSLPSLIAAWFRLIRRRPVVVTLHEHIPPHYLRTMLLPLLASAIVSVRPNFRDGFSKGFSWGAIGKRFQYIPNASTIPSIELGDHERAEIRRELGVPEGKRMVVFFGLIYGRRGVHQVFDIADPDCDFVVIVGGSPGFAKKYADEIVARSREACWRDSIRLTGFVPDVEAARVLAAADAVVLPFLDGGGVWNTSIHAARAQGTLVITTSTARVGFDEKANMFEAAPSDVGAMRSALRQFSGRRVSPLESKVPRWSDIAEGHISLFRELL
jgi:glycosyltransferase involved in cell wall biosynthesis